MKLLKSGNPLLTTLKADYSKATFPLESEVLDLIDDSKDCLRSLTGFWKGKGMSVAATQLGSDLPLFVMCHYKTWYTPQMYRKFMTVIRPKVTGYSEETCQAWEGCISNDDVLCKLERPTCLTVEFQSLKGQTH